MPLIPVPPEAGAMVAVAVGAVSKAVGETLGEVVGDNAGEIVGEGVTGEIDGVGSGGVVRGGSEGETIGEIVGVTSGEISNIGTSKERLIIIPVRAGMLPFPACAGIFCALSVAFNKIIAFSYFRIQTLLTFRGAESIWPRF